VIKTVHASSKGEVIEAKGFKEAFKAYSDRWLDGLSGDPNYGGQGLPSLYSTAS